MQPQNLIPNLPLELLFSCITGYSNPASKSALKIFILSNVKLTCKDLYVKVNQCWQGCLHALLEDWKDCPDIKNHSIAQMENPSRFLLNWIEGKPKISRQTVQDLFLNDLSFNINEADIPDIRRIPTSWITQPGRLNLAAVNAGSTSFIDMQQRQCIKLNYQGDAFPFLLKNNPPIFHGNDVFLVFNNPPQASQEVRFYSLQDQELLLEKTFRLPSGRIHSMYLLDDYLIFMLADKIAAISIADLKNSNTPDFLCTDTIRGLSCLKAFQGEILICSADQNEEICFQMLFIEYNQLKFSDCPLVGEKIFKTRFYPKFRHLFHPRSEYSVFLFQEGTDRYRLGAISPDELTPSEPQLFHIRPQEINGTAMIIGFKDTLLLCSKNQNNHLEIQIIDVNQGLITLIPLEIKGAEKIHVHKITSLHTHLDKLFIIGYFDLDPGYDLFNAQYYLTIIDMTTLVIESSLSIGYEMQQKVIHFSSNLGKLHFIIPEDKNPSILKVDYT